MNNTILHGSAIEMLRTMPAESVQMCVTSPPYFGLRDYGEKGQIGLEDTPEAYIKNLVAVLDEVYRVLKKDGTVWLNIGDSYWGGKGQSGSKNADAQADRQASGKSINGAQHQIGGKGKTRPTDRKHATIKPKELIGIPWLLAFALRNTGWYIRQEIIWHKPNPMPESVKDRCTQAHERIFLLVKNDKYYYDYKAMLEPAAYDGRIKKTIKGGAKTQQPIVPNQSANTMYTHGADRWQYDENGTPMRNRRSVWTVATKPFKGAHFATFPPDLILPCILAGSKKDDTVLDPFMGAGTTALVAKQNGRNYIGCEINAEYIEIANKRIQNGI